MFVFNYYLIEFGQNTWFYILSFQFSFVIREYSSYENCFRMMSTEIKYDLLAAISLELYAPPLMGLLLKLSFSRNDGIRTLRLHLNSPKTSSYCRFLSYKSDLIVRP